MHTIFAHRGASHQFAEHTRAAYLQALVEEADGVECDVHLTRDGQLVCIHDSTLDRTSNGTGDVADHTLRELRTLDFASWKGANIPAEFGGIADQFLSLGDLLELLLAAGREVSLAIELKHPSPFGLRLEEKLIAFLMQRGWDPESSTLANVNISFMSFSPDSVKHLLEKVPSYTVCQLVSDVRPQELRAELHLGALTAAAVIGLLRRALNDGEQNIDSHSAGVAGPGVDYVLAHPARVRRWIAEGIRIRAWTVDKPDDVEFMRELGVQEITTNRPAAVRAQLAKRTSGGEDPVCR
ncbi:glycerophosphodiester phosphodiesterase [Arthrobacter sp. HLT1-21]